MQWLIDLIIEAIGIPPTYIDRGDPAVEDFRIGDLILDNTWRELDLGSIVPAGATSVNLSVYGRADAVSKSFLLRKHGNTKALAIGIVGTVVANLPHFAPETIAVDADRKIDYYGSAATFDTIGITVLGWWL